MGEGVNGVWQIGVAKSNSLPTVPSFPTSTPTPTATITPTVTPTPTQPFSPIVIVPGLGASWNATDIFSCNLDSSGNWTMAPYVTLYNRLIKTLTENAKLKLNDQIYLYTYDWRLPLDKQGEKFNNYLNQIISTKPANTQFRLVGHSLGGLVIRSLSSNHPLMRNKIKKLLTIGTPHQGAVSAYPAWAAGEIWADNKLMKLALTQVINYCRLKLSGFPLNTNASVTQLKSAKDTIHQIVPSIQSLLPIFNYLRENGSEKPTNQLINQNNWLTGHQFPFSKYFPPSKVYTLSGTDFPTFYHLDITTPSNKEKKAGIWEDGKPIKQEKTNEGDGTVLNFSSQVGINNTVIRGNHGDIVNSNEAIQKILEFLDLSEISPAAKTVILEEESKNIFTLTVDQPCQITLRDPKNKISQSEENIITVYNPQVGVYKLQIRPIITSNANLHIIQISDEEIKEKLEKINLVKNRIQEYLLIWTSFDTADPKLIRIKT